MSKVPIIAGTMQTDPRSGGVKRSSGVNVLPIVNEGKVGHSAMCVWLRWINTGT